ncbi:HWE histidine kinase domain-containing protein [Rhizobium paknamense]|uniref:histidine kinase n=1 Tax=Rhizobium paknamense TaxID=1206817 RepID=A0ABU0IFV5_9HYPH|nr:HWE histidine kinase domain-containing protein [Rhizobium paknamense]MDQ0457141.1 light-regulated signal transduction histidine kinase (bacteriophytochrome)/CheY-like chemotaxis protein [Rhizobium paknamense]
MPSAPAVDLTNCDREPIHIPGSIQPHGCLLACDAELVTVLRHSANTAELLHLEGKLINRRINELLGDDVAHDLRNALAAAPDASRPAVIAHIRLPSGQFFDVAVHRQYGTAIVEFEPSRGRTQPLQLAREMIGRIKDMSDVDKLIKASARLVRAVLGYDRVMIYQFESDGSGKVVSEAKRADLESFLGQYFPASDIPQQARRLYTQNPIRVISDARGQRVPLVPELDPSGEPLDLSFAHLRSVSPIHLEYLRNMGVGASMSISILVNGGLWGLIACHNYSPKTLTMSERIAAEIFGEFFSLHLLALKQKRKLDLANDARKSLDRFLQIASHYANVEDLFSESLADFQSLFACDGVGLWMNDTWTAAGAGPPRAEVEPLMRFISGVADGHIWATHALALQFPAADSYYEDVSGVMAVPLSQIPRDYLLFFRKERLQTLNWAGNPEKSYEIGPMGDRLTPRKSFAIWKETVHKQAEAWSDSDRDIAEAVRSATVEIVLRHNELMQEERNKADIRQRVLNEELNHRVKNILAVIKSLVGAPTRPEQALTDYVGSLRGRIQALSHAHDQVIRGSGGGQLRELLQAELTPYKESVTAIQLDGPPVLLDSRAYAVTALVTHELSTNAAKYGALSRPTGHLAISWRWTEGGDCELHWVESGGPTVHQPRAKGFGSALIDRSIPYDLGGKSVVRYEPDGLKAHLLLPGRFLYGFLERSEPQAAASPHRERASMAPLDKNTRILLVEDQMLIAMDAEMMLGDAGFTEVTTAGSAPEALTEIRSQLPGLAVLDINLGNHTSVPVAEELARRGVPFIFATGYAERAIIPEAFTNVPVIAKPYDGDSLLNAIITRLRDRETSES